MWEGKYRDAGRRDQCLPSFNKVRCLYHSRLYYTIICFVSLLYAVFRRVSSYFAVFAVFRRHLGVYTDPQSSGTLRTSHASVVQKWVPYSQRYLFKAIPDNNHNANPTNPNRYSKGNPNPTLTIPTNPNTRYRCE